MRIGLMHYTSPPVVGGVESVLARHARLLADDGHEVSVITGRGEIFDTRIPVLNLPHLDSRDPEVLAVKQELDKGKKTANFEVLLGKILGSLTGILDSLDVLIAHNIVSLHKNLPLTAFLFSSYQTPGFPRLVLWHHDLAWVTPRYEQELHTGHPWDLLRNPWEGAWHVTVSEPRREELAKLLGIPWDRVHVIPNGVDLQTFLKIEDFTVRLAGQLHLFEANPLFLLPVRLTPRKNIELALQIMAELRKKYPKCMLVVTGPEGPHNPSNAAYRKKLVDLRDRLDLQDRVHFLADHSTGFIPDSVIADLYRLADAILLPSSEEGFGIPLIEAALAKTPVFCSNIPVLHKIGGEDVTYFSLDEDPGSIAVKIIERLEGETTSRWLRHAKQEYTWNSVYDRFIRPLIEEVSA